MSAIRTQKNQEIAFTNISKKFRNATKDPENFLSLQTKKSNEIKKLLKNVYDLTTSCDDTSKKSQEILPELILDGLDEEQIWQQIEIRNESIWPGLIEKTSKFLSMSNAKLIVPVKSNVFSRDLREGENEGGNDFLEDEENEEDDSMDEEEEEEEDDTDEEREENSFQMRNVKIKPSIVDDKFFKLSEMEAFLNVEDEKETRKQKGQKIYNGNDIDYFAENLSDEDEQNAEYGDFFYEDEITSKKLIKSGDESEESDEESNDEEEEEEKDKEGEPELAENDNQDEVDGQKNGNLIGEASDSEDDNTINDQPKSSFELRQDRLNLRIQQYEDAVLGEKPWQLKGEISSASRPQNSLLEEILEFDATTRPAPIITEDTTLRLEDIIRQRIKDSAWDDVERKVKPIHTPQEYRKKLVLDQEKSKESLAQIYEKEYRNELEKLNPNAGDADEEESKVHKEIKQMMRSLFIKLDALSNFHFTPKPLAPESKIITNTPAVNMEEVAPMAVSDAHLLAPEEIRRRAKGDVIGKSERNSTDKNRERRQKKTRQKAIHKATEERDLQKQKMGIQLSKKEEKAKILKNITKNRNVEKMNVNSSSSFKSSKAFFTQLQDKTTVAGMKVKTNKPDKNSMSAKKLKL